MRTLLPILFTLIATPAFACSQPDAVVAKICENRIKNSDELSCGKRAETRVYRADCRANCGYDNQESYESYLWDVAPWPLPAGYPPPPAQATAMCSWSKETRKHAFDCPNGRGTWLGDRCSNDKSCIIDGTLHTDPNDLTSPVMDSPFYCSRVFPARKHATKHKR